MNEIINRNTVLYCGCFDFQQIRFYVMIVSVFHNNKTTQQQIAETNKDCYFALVVQRVLKVRTYVFGLPHQYVHMSRAWREQIISPVITCSCRTSGLDLFTGSGLLPLGFYISTFKILQKIHRNSKFCQGCRPSVTRFICREGQREQNVMLYQYLIYFF